MESMYEGAFYLAEKLGSDNPQELAREAIYFGMEAFVKDGYLTRPDLNRLKSRFGEEHSHSQ